MTKKITLPLLIIFLTIFNISAGWAFFDVKSEDDKIVTEFKFLPYNIANVKILLSSIDKIKSDIAGELEREGKKTEKIALDASILACDLIKERLSILLDRASKPGAGEADLRSYYTKTMRIWYSLEASVCADNMEKKNIVQGAFYLIKMGVRLLGKPFVVRIPSCRDTDAAVGADKAALESRGLCASDGKIVSGEAMANMTARQISALEPAGESHVYRPVSGNPIDRFSELEKEITELTRICPGGDPDFDLQQARSVFMLEEVKTTATSPKVSAKDRYGFSWKFKWGNEVHTEILATRLYCALGGRYADLKYVISAGEAPLVLQPEGDKDGELKTLDDMITRFKNNGTRNFKMIDWVVPGGLQKSPDGKLLGHGRVDEQFIKKYKIKNRYLGAWYVWFKESSVSFNAPCAKRIGAAAFSDLGALDSRVARGSIIFNMLLMNFDAKDANNKMVLLYNPKTQKFDTPIEYQHDLGCILTASVLEKLTAGEINELDWKWMAKFPGIIGFNVGVMYHPVAWKKATYADAMWMARKVCALEPAVWEWAVSQAKWPSFAGSLLVERLKSRRNQLIDIFDLAAEGFKPFPVNRDLTIKVPADGGVIDFPVLNGRIVSPDKSITVRNAENTQHPEGIYATKSRLDD